MKKNFLVFSMITLLTGILFAQNVDLTGTVSNDAQGPPLANVNVSLKKRTGVTTATGADGTYHLTATASIIAFTSGFNVLSTSRLQGSVLEFDVTGENPVSVEVFAVRGTKVATVVNQNHPAPGNYSIDLNSQQLVPGLYLIRYRQGTESTVYQYMPVSAGQGRAVSMKSSSTPTANGLLKRTAITVDTLVFTLSGFISAQVPISSYSGQNDAVLQPQPAGATPAGMKSVPSVTFTEGSNVGYAQAAPPHQVTLSPYYIDTLVVMQGDYKALMNGVNPSLTVGDNLPVENITWYDMLLYCNARSKKDGLDTVTTYTAISGGGAYPTAGLTNMQINYRAKGYRLPTEAEWEYACRNTLITEYIQSATILTEWTTDFFATYTSDAQTDPLGPSMDHGYKVTRSLPIGGVLDCSARSSDNPVGHNGGLGFRCVRPQ